MFTSVNLQTAISFYLLEAFFCNNLKLKFYVKNLIKHNVNKTNSYFVIITAKFKNYENNPDLHVQYFFFFNCKQDNSLKQ